MSETHLASMFIGASDSGENDSNTSKGGNDTANIIHILDGQNDLILDVITLDKLIEDSHHKSLVDFIETYEFTALVDGSYAEYLTDRNRLIIPDDNGDLREFVIVKAEKIRDRGGLFVDVFAQATYLDLSKLNVVRPHSFKGTPSQHIGRALNDTGWQAGIVEVGGNITISEENFTSPYAYLRRIAKEFGGELNYRITHDGNKITGRYVDLLERIGQWRGKEVTLGKDLESIRRIEEQDVVTALLGLGPVREDGSRIEVLVEDADALQRWGRIDGNGKLHHLIEAYEIESERDDMTVAEARQYTRTALDKRISLMVSYETTIVDLADVAGLEHEEMFFGDTIRIKDEGFSPPLYLEARIFEMERSLKQKAKKDIKLGDYIEFSEEDVNAIWAQLQAEIQRRFEKLVIINISSSSGNTFKNGQGTTDLSATTFVNGAEYDEDGSIFNYEWYRYVDGELDQSYHETTKSITVNASDIDENAVYRVYVGKGSEVYAQSEVTVTNVDDGINGQDGEDGKDGIDGVNGADGKDGTDGESGRSVVEISEQYYLSTSETTVTGGAWLDEKPPITADKYLWMRTKITYDKAPLIEYTTPIIDDSWKALKTADGKNTVIFSDTEPTTIGRKPGDTWFDEANDYVMYKFDGNNWIKAQIGEQAIVANSITALHIKSLFGLNVNDQFIVDNEGNVSLVNAFVKGRVEALEGFFGDNIRLIGGKMEIVRPDGAVSMSDGMVDTGYTVHGNDPHYMTAGIAGGARFVPFTPGNERTPNDGNRTSAHIYGADKGTLDGRGAASVGSGYYADVRDSLGAVAIQKYDFIHSARYLVFKFRKYAGSTFSVHIVNGTSADVNQRIYFEKLEYATAGVQTFIIDLGKPLYNNRAVTLKIGWVNSWGPREEVMRFIIEGVFLTDFI